MAKTLTERPGTKAKEDRAEAEQLSTPDGSLFEAAETYTRVFGELQDQMEQLRQATDRADAVRAQCDELRTRLAKVKATLIEEAVGQVPEE